ncbi:bacillithiol biosynthesis cysteine-adding enzyme BshC [Aurantibacter crassamenti]|uniref:bacillithiol biosynthesis cysteine-adding enzyme BshC n=1 Tax=Aurantibacter crassamenti TaxID=1837375 RepID=UPI001939AE71|nr:bacillithiol biosynthesis cysteine-adding enzyme BshC [Aurantibacter crassamenti]MBM1107927.1 bacillithiol biosynthesis cysteine-adding enzyme BshC [Aurantibacter crassamenti]
MDVDCINYKQTGYFSKLICDYLNEDEAVKPFYTNFPTLKNFEAQIEEKQRSFPDANRNILYDSLINQYVDVSISKKTKEHLIQLKEPITFTVVTGHQLNLFTGPLYFLYKIISTINLTKTLKKEYPKYNFVPVYWMATEDHDFEEINYFNFKGKKLHWNPEGHVGGAVGPMSTEGLQEVFEAFASELGSGENADFLKNLFEKAYVKHQNLTDATRFLANELFGEYGLVIIDGHDTDLKKLLMPYAKKDIFENIAHNEVSASIDLLQKASDDYKVQVNPREINYFYLKDGLRERIVAKANGYGVVGTDINWTKTELLQEIDEHPSRFSPNVIARPLYQEVILPNLCYIGGGGELAYWLELKSMFGAMSVPFPALLLRNSALIVSEKAKAKTAKLDLSVKDLFLDQNSLINKKIRAISNIDIDFTPQKELLEKQFADLYILAEQTDKSFLGAVKAQEIKQKKGLDNLENRLMQAQKRKLKDQVLRVTELQNELFPNHSLQERIMNFSELYLEYGEDLIPQLIDSLKPLDLEFTVLS